MKKRKTINTRWIGWLCLILMIGLGIGLYKLKYKVMALEESLRTARKNISHEEDTIRILEAEWQYLTSPHRLAELNKKAGLKPVETAQVRDMGFLQEASVASRPGSDDKINRHWIRASYLWD